MTRRRHRPVNSDSRGDASRQCLPEGLGQALRNDRPGASRQNRASTVARRPPPITWQTARCEATVTGWLFVLPIPERTNAVWRQWKGRTLVSAKHRADKQAAPAIFGRCAPMIGEVVVRIGWVRQRKAGDTDGRIKSTLDLLRGIAYADDAQVASVQCVRFDTTDHAPGVYVWVEPFRPLRLEDLAA